jgi:hypothetical protein
MSQVHTVHVAPKLTKKELLKAVLAADAVLEAEKRIKKLSRPERFPQDYFRDQKIEALSDEQLRGELRRAPQTANKALVVVLDVLMESLGRGVSPFPR